MNAIVDNFDGKQLSMAGATSYILGLQSPDSNRHGPGFVLRSDHAEFVVDKVALELVLSEHFIPPYKFWFHIN
jgi:hypothetical protein